MKILWVKAGKLIPVDTGGKIRSYHILKELIRCHEVTLLSYYNGAPDKTYDNALQIEFPGAQSFCTRLPDSSTPAELFHYLRHFLRPVPFAISRFNTRRTTREVTSRIRDGAFDVAVCDFLVPSLSIQDAGSTPVVLFQHNVESVLWRRKKCTESNPLKRTLYAFEAFKMETYEIHTLRRLRNVIAVSEQDKQQMLKMSPHCTISVVPTGVNTSKPATSVRRSQRRPTLVFTGSMDWQPNVDGVLFFCRHIFPLVQQEFPNATFQIVGRNPPPQVRRLASASIEVTGTVRSVDGYLQDATLVVVPLRIGGGTRLKILEAMVRGRAVISTTVGAEGLNIYNGKEIVIADTPNDFASSICSLLSDPTLRSKYEQAGLKYARRHDWSDVATRFGDALSRVVTLSRSATLPAVSCSISAEVVTN